MSFEQPKSIEEEKAKIEHELFSELERRSGHGGPVAEGKPEVNLNFDYNKETGEVERSLLTADIERSTDKAHVLVQTEIFGNVWPSVKPISPEGANAFLNEQLAKTEARLIESIGNATKWVEVYKKQGRDKEAAKAQADLEKYQRNLAGFRKEKERLMVEKK